MIVAMDVARDEESARPVERGDMSLALAGAELVDLLGAEAAHLDGERIVPGYRPTITDGMLDEAASALVREAPQESVEDWLWRRGRGLAGAYLAALEADGQLTRRRHRWSPFRSGTAVLADSATRRRAADRWAAREPVLTALAVAAGVGEEGAAQAPDVADDDMATVLATVHDAVRELEAERQRRAIEQTAYDNIWRDPGG